MTLGQEAPMVHIVCCIGNVYSRLFAKYRNNEAKKREILSACCATGISVAFGAPIGGVLFSLEETSSYFPPKTLWRALFASVIGAMTLKLINPEGLDILIVNYSQPYHWFELIVFCFIGVIGGVIGTIFIRIGTAYTRFRKRWLAKLPILEAAVVCFITVLLSFPNPYMQYVLEQYMGYYNLTMS